MKARVKDVRIIIPLWPEVAALLQEAATERSMTIDELAKFLLEKHLNDFKEEKLESNV